MWDYVIGVPFDRPAVLKPDEVYAVVVHPESERHRRRRRGDERQDVARGEDAESRRVRRRSASRRRTDEETEAVERTLSRPVSSDESDADPQPA